MVTAISPAAVAAHLCDVQSGLQMLYGSARAFHRQPGRFHPTEVAKLRTLLARGAFETWRCEQLLSGIDAANDSTASPARA